MTASLQQAKRAAFDIAARGGRWACFALLVAGANLCCCQIARADGGQLQTSERVGPWIVSVFTSPTPPRVGPVDVSVLVQQAESGATVADASIRLTFREVRSGFELERFASREAATNKLFQAAWFEPPTAGKWIVTAEVTHAGETASTAFDLWVSAAPPAWSEMVLWIVWPLLPIGLYSGAQIRGARRKIELK